MANLPGGRHPRTDRDKKVAAQKWRRGLALPADWTRSAGRARPAYQIAPQELQSATLQRVHVGAAQRCARYRRLCTSSLVEAKAFDDACRRGDSGRVFEGVRGYGHDLATVSREHGLGGEADAGG